VAELQGLLAHRPGGTRPDECVQTGIRAARYLPGIEEFRDMFSFKDARFADECEQLAKRLEKLRAGRPGHALRASPADTRRARGIADATVHRAAGALEVRYSLAIAR
jgi:hypothetical protein